MTTQPLPASPVYRRAYACGRALKRVFRRTRMVEARLAERAGRAGVPAAKVLVYGGFLVAVLVLIAALFFVIAWTAILMGGLLYLCFLFINSKPNHHKEPLRFKAYGDPYGEYELRRASGQPDLDDV